MSQFTIHSSSNAPPCVGVEFSFHIFVKKQYSTVLVPDLRSVRAGKYINFVKICFFGETYGYLNLSWRLSSSPCLFCDLCDCSTLRFPTKRGNVRTRTTRKERRFPLFVGYAKCLRASAFSVFFVCSTQIEIPPWVCRIYRVVVVVVYLNNNFSQHTSLAT